ncbi:sensor histidine kinase [Leptospira neocaledonica]|uniref:histidine kinase n=1 Tax=Leptospira neocaledonica TaxID=2023192 RepID=A0A2M9ZY46_9LEPT|nr:sensor histidine kinase [Leptospira neocaledonica]PJZ76965.1 histidine kinase [Leptospira neocaledonica]
MRFGKITFFALLISSFFSYCDLVGSGSEHSSAKNGTLDLSKHSFEDGKIVPLDGEWEFYWEEWISPNDFSDPKFKSKKKFVTVPSVWKESFSKDPEAVGHGYATYRLKVKLGKRKQALALKIPDQGTAYILYANGKKIASVGSLGKSESESKAKYELKISLVPDSENLELVFYVSNFQNRWGGVWNSIQLGELESVLKDVRKRRDLEWALVLIAATMSFYNVFFYFFRRNESAHLLFAFHAFLIMVRSLTIGDSRLAYELLQGISWELPNRLEYISVYISGPTLYAFLYRYCKTDFWRRFGRYFVIPYYLASFIVLFFPNAYYTLTLLPVALYLPLVTMPVWLVLLAVGLKRGIEGGLSLFSGYVVISLCTLNDIGLFLGLWNGIYLIQYGEVALILGYSILISKIFSEAFRRSDTLGTKMKSLVLSTREIMQSYSYDKAADTALKMLHENGKEQTIISNNGRTIAVEQTVYVYLEEPNSSIWKRYCISSLGDLETVEVYKYDVQDLIGLDPSSLTGPIIKNDRLVVSVQDEQLYKLIFDLPSEGYSDDSQMDWVRGVADALAFSVRNIARQDREKLAIIGELSAEIVHDLGHPIAMIRQNLKNLRSKKGTSKTNLLFQAEKEVDALTNLTLDILDFSKNRIILDLQTLEIKAYFKEIFEDLETFFQSTKMKLAFKINAKGSIRLDPLRIRRLIFNLAKNAAEATDEKGIFSIRIEREEDIVYLIFEDNGQGFSKDMERYIFDSGFGSKKPYGTGLGLSIIRKIVFAHGGEILVSSEEGKGTRFTILLRS